MAAMAAPQTKPLAQKAAKRDRANYIKSKRADDLKDEQSEVLMQRSGIKLATHRVMEMLTNRI
jgi:hypothetical protein